MPASAASNRPEELTIRLGAQGEALLKTLREVKNQIIGNKTKKLLYLQLGAVPKIVSVLASAASSGNGSDAAVIVQAAVAVGSFACGIEDGVRAVLEAGAVPNLTSILSHPVEKVVDAAARSLKIIFKSKLAPKCDFLQEKSMKFLLSLLNSDNENVTELAASIITHSCERNVEQKALWNAGVLQRLVSLLGGSSNQNDACLESIAAIVRNNSEVASKFACINEGKALNTLTDLLQDRCPQTRLLASVCLIAVGHVSSCYAQDLQIKTKIVLVLVELLDEPGRVGDDAPFSLTNLITENEELHRQAYSLNAVEKLCNILHKIPANTRRLQGILFALAELCSKLEKCRSQIMSLQVSDLIFDALHHDCTEVRIAACCFIRNISRSLKILSAGRLSNQTVVRLLQLLHDPSITVQIAALGAICNVAVNCTTRRSSLFQCGGVSELVQLSKSINSTLRLKAMCALRNLMLLANNTDKECILRELTVCNLASLICDSELFIQEQALALVNNLLDGCDDSIKLIFLEQNLIINAVMRQLQSSPSDRVCIQGMFVLSNIVAAIESVKESVMDYVVPSEADSTTPSFVIKFLQSKDNLLRVAALWCIINLTYPGSASSSKRIARLRESGIISQLKAMINDPFLECKLRVRMALEQCMDFQSSQA